MRHDEIPFLSQNILIDLGMPWLGPSFPVYMFYIRSGAQFFLPITQGALSSDACRNSLQHGLILIDVKTRIVLKHDVPLLHAAYTTHIKSTCSCWQFWFPNVRMEGGDLDFIIKCNCDALIIYIMNDKTDNTILNMGHCECRWYAYLSKNMNICH